ncbi:MAG: hypothetical protein ACRCZB_10235, partial [Bacteroidales bacterium]
MKTLHFNGLVLVWLFFAMPIFAQNVSIGDQDFVPNPAAILEIQSTNKGLLIPRLTYVQRMYISANAQSTGLLVYQTDQTPGFYYFDGLAWKYLSPSAGSTGNIFTGDYNDLLNKPDLKSVATTGSYNDLSDKPEIPSRLQDLWQDENYYTTVSRAERESWNAKSTFSGDYNDLQNSPKIPTMLRDLEQDYNFLTVTEREKEKWDEAAQGNNFSGDYNDLQNKPTIPTYLSELNSDIMHNTVTTLEK